MIEHFSGDAQSNGVPMPLCGDDKEASIDVTFPIKSASVEIIADEPAPDMKKRKGSSFSTKKCIRKPFGTSKS